MLTHPMSTMRILCMLMNLSLGHHVTLLPGEFRPHKCFPQSGLRCRTTHIGLYTNFEYFFVKPDNIFEKHLVIFLCTRACNGLRILAIVWASVCLSVRLSHCGIVSNRHKLGSRNFHCGLPQGL